MKYNPSLDVLRVFAVAAVLAFHARVPGFEGGWLGVDLFFVLSGYLITTLLLREKQNGGIHLLAFYGRRLRRLWPALLFLLAGYFIAAPFLWPAASAESVLRNVLIAGTYSSDYGMAYWGLPRHIHHTWSLAVEEHYYLLWAPVIALLCRLEKHRLILAVALLYLLATSVRFLTLAQSADWIATYYAFHTRLSGLMLGSLAAIFLLEGQRSSDRSAVYAWCGLGASCAVISMSSWNDDLSITVGIMVAELGALALVVASVHRPAWLNATRLSAAGKYTYGIYLWHYPIMNAMSRHDFGWPSTLALGSFLSIALAIISFHTIEAMFRRERNVYAGCSLPTP